MQKPSKPSITHSTVKALEVLWKWLILVRMTLQSQGVPCDELQHVLDVLPLVIQTLKFADKLKRPPDSAKAGEPRKAEGRGTN